MEAKAVVLVSGGLDSAVTLFFARREGYDTYALVFDYGQRHEKEMVYAHRIAKSAGSRIKVIKLDLPWKGSSLVDKNIKMPHGRSLKEIERGSVPSTYVPARNTVFLSIAASFAEGLGASSIFIGAHSEDSSGYPDCRKEYLKAFGKVISLGTKLGIKGKLGLEFPLIDKTKKEIIKLGNRLGVPFQHTWSCYTGGKRPCGRCDSCILRAKGFKEAGMEDPLEGRACSDLRQIS